jgi:protein phosphatase PTC7
MRVPIRLFPYNCTLKREIARKSSAKTAASTRAKADRTLSTVTSLSRPYAFHIAASWAGKPNRQLDPRFQIPFPSEGPIGSWRDKTLSRPKAVKSVDAGEDFLFVQEVS